MSAAPQRFEDAVGKTQANDVLHRLDSQEVIQPEDQPCGDRSQEVSSVLLQSLMNALTILVRTLGVACDACDLEAPWQPAVALQPREGRQEIAAKVGPSVPGFTVVFAHRAPLPFT